MTDPILKNFDQLSGEIDADQQRRIGASGLLASGRNPDQYARANALADKLGAPVDVVHDNLVDFEGMDNADAFSSLHAAHPELGGLISDPRWRTLAQDQASQVGNLASAIKASRAKGGSMFATGSGTPNDPFRLNNAMFTGKKEQYADVWDAAPVGSWVKREDGTVAMRDATIGENIAGALSRGWAALKEAPSRLAATMTLADVQQRQQDEAAGQINYFTAGLGHTVYVKPPTASESKARAMDVASAVSSIAASDRRIQQNHDATQAFRPLSVQAVDSAQGVGQTLRAVARHPVDTIMNIGVESGVQFAPAMVAGLVTKNPTVVAGLAGGTSGAMELSNGISDYAQRQNVDTANPEAMRQFLLQGDNLKKSLEYAKTRGAIIGSVDALTGPIGKYLHFSERQIGHLAAREIANIGLQTATGAAAGAGGEAGAQYATTGQVNGKDVVLEAVGELASTPGEVSGFALDRIQTARQHQALNAITAAAADSKLAERSPASLEATVASVAGDQRVHISAESARQLFQSEQALQDLVGGQEVLAEQMATGDLSIPMAKWVGVVSKMENADEINRHARLDPDSVSAAEMERLDEEAAKFADDTSAAADRAAPNAPDSRQQVIDDVMGQLIATERYSPAQAEAQAKLWGAAFGQFAARSGQDAFGLYQRYMAGVKKAGSDPLASRPFSGSARLDAVIEAVKTGVEPKATDLYGPSLTSWLVSQGGVQDQTGELRGFDARTQRPGLVNGQGLTLDRARELAAEAGYLPADSTVADMLDLIDRDLRNGDVFSPKEGDSARQSFDLERRQVIDAIDNTPALRDLPRDQLAAMTNQQISDALFGSSLDQTAYHGTPHVVDRFSLQKIGTGEGAQAYGWGLYFASEKAVADHYKEVLGGGAFQYDGESVYGETPKRIAVELLWSWQGDKQGASDDADGYENANAIKREIAKLDPSKITHGGRVYSVDIPENSDLLDLDKPLSEQPEKVRKALESIDGVQAAPGKFLKGSQAGVFAASGTNGKGYYDYLASQLGSPEATSKLLRNAGIPGLRYFDGQSRSGGGTHNYVIWDENAIGTPTRLYQSAVPQESEIDRLRARVAELENELRTDRLTGMRNQRAFEEDESLGWSTVAAADMDGLKKLNDAIGHEHADTVLRSLGGVLLASEGDGIRFYRRSGDEFAARFQDPAKAEEVMRQVQQRLEDIAIDLDVADADGNIRSLTYNGIGLTYGTGHDYQTADTAANASKRDRLAAGIREDARAGGNPRRLQPRAGQQGGSGADSGSSRPAANRGLIARAADAVRSLFQESNAAITERQWKAAARDFVKYSKVKSPVYHATASSFDSFDTTKSDLGAHFGTLEQANQIAEGRVSSKGVGPSVMKVYLNLENPLRLKDEGSFHAWSIAEQLLKKGIISRETASRWEAEAWRENVKNNAEARAAIKAAGYDGVVYKNTQEAAGDSYIAFDATQIKSATANRGTFDPNDPSTLNQQNNASWPRGQINIFPDRRMSIQLFENADRSTFLHESAHFFFEVMRDLATDENPDIKADFDALLGWFGAENADALTTDHLEQFARGFESYVGEGKAPSPELRGIFAKFSAWILGVYRSLKALNVSLTDDVRSVFDRILASDDEIEAAKVRQGMQPIARDASEAKALGLTDKQWADYLAEVEAATEEARLEVFNKTVGALQREQRAWWKEERAKVREEVEAKYEAAPAVRALHVLSGRKVVDGVELSEPLAGLKLDRGAIVANWGEAYLKRLGKTYAKSGGVHPDEAAAVLGYSSGDDLLRALANAPDTLARVDAETDAIMRERHGDPMVDGSLPEKAMAAVHGNKRVRLLERELSLLASLAGEPAPPPRILRAIAERAVAAKTPRQLRPNDYLVAERRAAREALQATAKRDFGAALQAKRKQALNVALYSAARAAQEQFDKDMAYLRRVSSNDRRARLGKAGGDYLEQVDSLLESVELKAASGPEVQRRQRLAEWVKKQEDNGNPVDVPARLLEETGLTNIRDMTHADIRGVVDTIKQIEHLAKTKTRLWLAGQERDRDEVDAEMSASVLSAHKKIPERTGDPTFIEKVKSGLADLDVGRMLPTNIARELDGYEDGGAVWSNVIRPIRVAMAERVIPAMHKMQDEVAAIYAKHYTGDELRRLDSPVWRESVGDHWSKGRILSLAMNWGSDGNREAIMSQAKSRLSEEQAIGLLRTLDSRDWQFVQDIVDKVNSYWPEIAETQRRRTGLVPEKVESNSFTIEGEDGEMHFVRGGYFPLKYDSERSGYGTTLNEIDDIYNSLRVGRTAKAATRNGHTIERVGSGGKAVALGLDIASAHMRDVIRDLHLGDAVAYVHNVLHGSQFADAAISVGKRTHLKSLELWLKDVAAGEMGARSATEKVLRFARQNTTAAVLTYKPAAAALQVSGIVQTGSIIGNRNALHGVRLLLSKSWIGPNSIWNDIREKSAFMRERFGQIPEAVEIVQSQRAGKLKSAHAAMIRWGYIPMARVQMIADAASWLAGERVGLKKFNGDVDKARAFADDLVVRAQSPEGFFDKSALSRGTLDEKHRQSELVKTSTMLLSYMIAKGNVAREKYQATSFTSPIQIARFSVDMVQLFAVEAMISALVRGGLPSDDDDDGVMDDWIAYISKEVGLGFLATIPLASQLGTEGRGYTAQGVMDRSWSTLADATGAWFDDELDRKDLKQAITVSGMMTGAPSSQINTTADALWKVHDGDDVSPIDFVVRQDNRK